MSWPSPVFPDAPGTFETGMATPRIGWACWPIVRAMASAPPPAPHVTMKSIGRDGYFSWAPAAGSPTRIIHAEMKTHHARTPGILRFALIAPPPPSRAPTSALNLPNVRQNLLAQGHELRAGLDRPAGAVAGLPTERGLDRGQNTPRPRRHDENPCAEIAGLLHAVGDEEHGLPGGLPDLKQLFLEMLARQRIQGAEGLVHQEDPGIVDEDPGDGDALLHAARQLIGGLGAKVPQPHQAEVGLRQLPPPRRRQPPHLGTELHVLLNGQPGEERRLLEHHTPLVVRPRDLGVVQPDAPRAGRDEARDDPKQGGLPAAGGPNDADKVSLLDAQRDALQGGDRPVAGGVLQRHVVDLQDGPAHRLPRRYFTAFSRYEGLIAFSMVPMAAAARIVFCPCRKSAVSFRAFTRAPRLADVPRYLADSCSLPSGMTRVFICRAASASGMLNSFATALTADWGS